MKNACLSLLAILLTTSLSAQLFTKLTEGPVVNTISDSRSVHLVDVNGDGWDDIFISNGLNGGQNDLLYLNNGDGTFSESESAITNDGKSSVGATFADYDNDGDLDAFVTNWYGQINGLFENDGQGIFTLMDQTSIPQLNTFSETASWGDFDNDGFIDLYVTNSDGNKKNQLFHNNGMGIFTAIDTGAVVNETDLSRNTDWLDIDNDGDMDILVSNENNQANDLFLNDGFGYFEKVVDVPLVTETASSMSFSSGDIDNDGDLDLFVANAGYFQEQDNQLYRNVNGVFEPDNSSVLSTDGGCSYSSSFGDYDNDGDLDLVVSNGFCNSNLENYLYENTGSGNFQKVTDALPDLEAVCSYGLAWGDLNNDGFLDLVMANCKNNTTGSQQANDVYMNDGNQNNWMQINLVGTVSNQSAIGAKVLLTSIIDGVEVTQLRTVSAQTGYSGQNSLRVHFGLKDAEVANEIKILWPSGIETIDLNVGANQSITIIEQTTAVDQVTLAAHQMQIIPNPTDGNFTLSVQSENPLPDSLVVKIMDNMGRMIFQKNITPGALPSIQLPENIIAGKYLLVLFSEDRLLAKKWMVKF